MLEPLAWTRAISLTHLMSRTPTRGGESGREGIKDAKEQIYYCSAAMKRDLDERRKKVETRARLRGRGRGTALLFAGRGGEILMR